MSSHHVQILDREKSELIKKFQGIVHLIQGMLLQGTNYGHINEGSAFFPSQMNSETASVATLLALLMP